MLKNTNFDTCMTVPSPCISNCKIDEISKFCIGCLRTIDEIMAWSAMNDDEKTQVWKLLQQRAASNGSADTKSKHAWK
jgi:uncharacterized protein